MSLGQGQSMGNAIKRGQEQAQHCPHAGSSISLSAMPGGTDTQAGGSDPPVPCRG